MTTIHKPIPIPDEQSAPFFEGARRGELMLLRCWECGTFMWPGAPFATSIRTRCINCFAGNLEWAPSAGLGALFTYALMHQVFDPAFADEVPYNVSIVELDEGARVTTNIVDCPNGELHIGMPVQALFVDAGDGIVIPKFRRRASQE